MRRIDDRGADELRPIHIETGVMKFAQGSAMIETGDTRVLVSATLERRVPPFLINSGKGWATAEYSMLPCATPGRSAREVARGRPSGRSSEIQRLIGRSLRSVLDLEALAEHTLILDCDVLQADGGTRTASITGAYVAAVETLGRAFLQRDLVHWPFVGQVAAISVGLVEGVPVLDLDAPEDQSAEVDMNVVATADGNVVEIQGTGEERSFSRQELDRMVDLALGAIPTLAGYQNDALASILEEVDTARAAGGPKVKPRDEREIWGAPPTSKERRP